MPSSRRQSRCLSRNADTLIRKRSQVQVLVPPPANIPGQPAYGSTHQNLTTVFIFATVPPACPILFPRPLPAVLIRAPYLALYQLAEAIGDRPLTCITAVKVDQRGPGTAVTHTVHQLAQRSPGRGGRGRYSQSPQVRQAVTLTGHRTGDQASATFYPERRAVSEEATGWPRLAKAGRTDGTASENGETMPRRGSRGFRAARRRRPSPRPPPRFALRP